MAILASRCGRAPFRLRPLLAALAAAAAGGAGCAQAENRAEALEMPAVQVVGATPLPGLGLLIRDVPANVQAFGNRELERTGAGNLAEFLERGAGSITINSSQGNPFQPDVNFRGSTASPVLGTPQGLSVFLDGVRVNEPFGDAVNWDLIPQSAISSLQLVPGSNPAYGLNTLGGALAVNTKSGSQYPGGVLEARGGSFGQNGGVLEYGGKKENLDWFLTADAHDDRGWGEHNAGSVRRFFGKLGWQDEKSDLDLSLTLAGNTLHGSQTLPLSMLGNPVQAYTWPDSNRNDLGFVTLKGSRFLTDTLVLGGNAYIRRYRNSNFSSNVNNDFDPANPASPQATNDLSGIDQDSWGLGGQFTWLGRVLGRDNQFTLGASGDFGRAHFTQDSQQAAFTADRGTVGLGGFSRMTDALTRNDYYGLFFSDTLNLNRRWTLTASGRYNQARVRIEDLSGTAPGLNGDNRFAHFNPAMGINFNPHDRLTAWAGYNQGARMPTPIELACADPAAPCKLPNNFLSDPPLRMVVARTVEGGLRGGWSEDDNWSVALFRTELLDDIQFISAGAGAANAGYFQNVGRTRRQGVELALSGRSGRWKGRARAGYLDASFQTPFTVHSPNNSAADAGGNIAVRPGNRIPGIPRWSVKLRLEYAPDDKAELGMDLNGNGPVHARGDENNQDARGRVPGFAVVNLDGRYRAGKGVEVFAQVANLLDRRYANFGTLGRNWFTGPGNRFDGANPVAEQFRAPGAPRGLWLGVSYRWQ